MKLSFPPLGLNPEELRAQVAQLRADCQRIEDSRERSAIQADRYRIALVAIVQWEPNRQSASSIARGVLALVDSGL